MIGPGEVIDGKYRVERVLGRGGMGVVVGASHLALGQKVAIKLLLPDMLTNPVIVERFNREARAAAGLRSDHVARVVDVGSVPRHGPYMVMEFLEGSDLEDVAVRDGPLAPDVAVNCVLQACEAIAEAHERGIIHRDLKPQNLFLTRRLDGSPFVKVLDFGISKIKEDPSRKALTGTADVMGSPLYMSPEQMRAVRDVDPRADIWALGAILYRVLVGVSPFDGETMAQICSRVMMDEPPTVHSLRPDVPEGLSQVIERCLRKEPDARYPDVAELARALDPFSSHQSLRAIHGVLAASNRPPPLEPVAAARGSGRLGMVLLVALVATGAGASFVLFRPRAPKSAEVVATTAAPTPAALSASTSAADLVDAGVALAPSASASTPSVRAHATPKKPLPKKPPPHAASAEQGPHPVPAPDDGAPELRK